MNTKTFEQKKAGSTSASKTSVSGLLQSKSGCGCTAGLPGGCSECQSRGLEIQPRSRGLDDTQSASNIGLDPLGRQDDPVAPFISAPNFGHDFSRVRIFSLKPTSRKQNSSANEQMNNQNGQASDQRTEKAAMRGMSIPVEGGGDIIDLPTRSTARQSNNNSAQTARPESISANIPESSQPSVAPTINDINGDGGGSGGGGGGGGGAAPAGDICEQPISMNKVVSGTFLGGLGMGDYYPDLVGGGYWNHGDTGGPFDTGSRVGANVQLWGDYRIPCRSDLFSLAQTVTYTRAIFNGVHDPNEGVVQDDIANSGRDFSRPPTRQEFGPAGGGWAISMADPPSVGYGASSDIEFDRNFVTTLIGPGGRRSVNWSTSIRVVGGSVTRNTIT